MPRPYHCWAIILAVPRHVGKFNNAMLHCSLKMPIMLRYQRIMLAWNDIMSHDKYILTAFTIFCYIVALLKTVHSPAKRSPAVDQMRP